MFITDLNKMEEIVSTQKHLSWDGWTVVERIPDNRAMHNASGVISNGKWYMEKRFVPSREGWKIPTKYVR